MSELRIKMATLAFAAENGGLLPDAALCRITCCTALTDTFMLAIETSRNPSVHNVPNSLDTLPLTH